MFFQLVFYHVACKSLFSSEQVPRNAKKFYFTSKERTFETCHLLNAEARVDHTLFAFGSLRCQWPQDDCLDGAFASVLRWPLIDNAITL